MAGIILFTFLLLVSCDNTTDSDTIVARVGSSVLTKDDITNQTLGSGPDDEEGRITQWVNVELLYLAGSAAGINKDNFVLGQVENYRKKLIGQAYLDMILQSRVRVSPKDIKEYYNEHKEMFKRRHDEATINRFTVNSKKEANKIRLTLEKRGINKGRNELFEKHNISAISVKDGGLMPVINKGVFGKSRSNYFGPVKTGSGFTVVEIIKRFPKGTYRSLDVVYDNIYLVIQKRRAAVQSVAILDSLRREYLFELNVVVSGR